MRGLPLFRKTEEMKESLPKWI
jgi:ABC-type sugar transport system, ATPase component